MGSAAARPTAWRRSPRASARSTRTTTTEDSGRPGPPTTSRGARPAPLLPARGTSRSGRPAAVGTGTMRRPPGGPLETCRRPRGARPWCPPPLEAAPQGGSSRLPALRRGRPPRGRASPEDLGPRRTPLLRSREVREAASRPAGPAWCDPRGRDDAPRPWALRERYLRQLPSRQNLPGVPLAEEAVRSGRAARSERYVRQLSGTHVLRGVTLAGRVECSAQPVQHRREHGDGARLVQRVVPVAALR